MLQKINVIDEALNGKANLKDLVKLEKVLNVEISKDL